MGKQSALLENFNTGEMSPMVGGRVGFDKYPNGASILENFIPTTQGPNVRRGGTRFVREVKDSADDVLLVPFEYSVDQAYMLEFGDLYVRFYTWDAVTKVRGILESSPGVPVEVVTPYAASELYNDDATPRLRAAQSGDFLYLTHPSHQQRILKRLTVTSFQLDTFVPKGGPWQTLNDTATTIYTNGQTGAVNVTASTGIFSPGDVGSNLYLEEQEISDIPAWEVGQDISIGNLRRSDGKTYKALNAGRTGTSRPVHTEGAMYDGGFAQAQIGSPGDADFKAPVPISVQWEYSDPGYGYLLITGYVSSTNVTGTVVDKLPSGVILSGNATRRWAFAEWSAKNGWPSDVAFFRERLWFGRGRKLWSSVSADFTDFAVKSFGQVTADMGIAVELSSGKINDLQWMTPGKDLLVGTAGGEFAIGELTNGEPLGPGNRRSKLISEFGSRRIPPIKNSDSVLFINRAGLAARENFYEFSSDGYKSTDATVLADHITLGGITQMAFASDPNQVVWMVRADGLLIGFTWNNEQNVRGWHRQPIGGNGKVRALGVMPAAEGDRSELWLVVERVIGGVTKKYVEYMERPYREGDTQASQFYVDSGLTYSGAATTTITGLGHAAGQEVSVLVNGAPHPNVTVSGAGGITLQLPATVAQIGFPCPARYRSMRIEAGAQDGTAVGKTKRISKVSFRLLQTGGGKYGALKPGSQMDYFLYRTTSNLMDQPVPLFSGDKLVSWPTGYDTDAYVGYEIDQPVAATIVACMVAITTQDAR